MVHSLIVTIGGLPGSGKSTLGKLLAARMGVPFFSMGDVRRAYAHDRGWSIEQLNAYAEKDPESDHLVDRFQERLPAQTPSFVIDSRLGYHFIPGAFRIFLHAPVRVCAERIFAQRRSSESWKNIEEGVASLNERIACDQRRYRALYNIDPTDESQYDLVLDAEHADQQELLRQTLAALTKRGVVLPAQTI